MLHSIDDILDIFQDKQVKICGEMIEDISVGNILRVCLKKLVVLSEKNVDLAEKDFPFASFALNTLLHSPRFTFPVEDLPVDVLVKMSKSENYLVKVKGCSCLSWTTQVYSDTSFPASLATNQNITNALQDIHTGEEWEPSPQSIAAGALCSLSEANLDLIPQIRNQLIDVLFTVNEPFNSSYFRADYIAALAALAPSDPRTDESVRETLQVLLKGFNKGVIGLDIQTLWAIRFVGKQKEFFHKYLETPETLKSIIGTLDHQYVWFPFFVLKCLHLYVNSDNQEIQKELQGIRPHMEELAGSCSIPLFVKEANRFLQAMR